MKHARRAPARRLAINLLAVLAMLLGSFGFALAAEPIPPAAERFAVDPYEQWGGEFLDFAPPTTDTLTLSQPDGAAFSARLTPMETGGRMETLDGYTVVKDEQGWWRYAEAIEGTLTPSALVVGRDDPAGLPLKAGQTDSIWLDANDADVREPLFDAVKNVQSPNASRFTANDVEPKRYRYVVILVDYQDVKFEEWQTAEWFQAQLSGLGTADLGSITDFYNEMSYGRFIPELDVYGPVTSEYPMAKFDYQLPGGWSVSAAISNEIGPKVAGMIDWDKYDNDRVVYTTQGTQYRSVDMVVLLHAGPDKAATGLNGHIWSHASTANFRTGYYGEDGRELRIRAANTSPGGEGFNIGVVAHEMGHSIGEPDYYATSYNNAGTGDWELMAGGSWMGDSPAGSNPTHMNPFSKVNQGWVEPVEVTDTTLGIELLPRSVAPSIVKIPLGGSGSGSTGAEESLWIEYVSNRVPGAIFDKAAHASGLMIWRYDRGGSQNNLTRARMEVVEYDYRDGTQDLRLNFNRGELTDPWTDTALGLTPYTAPSTDRHTPLDGMVKTGWHIMNISPLGETMTVDVVRAEDVAARIGLDRPLLARQPVIAGAGPVDITAKVYNLTAEPLENVRVQFFATMGGAQVQLAETTLPTLPPGAPTVATATWQTPVAGKWPLTVVATVGEATVAEKGMARIFARPAPILIVDDDDGYTAEEAFEGVLTTLGYPYVVVEHTADLATLQQHEVVIWSAGQAGRQAGQLNVQEIADLKAYLNAGGKLWMSSPRLAAALASTGSAPGVDPAMLSDYFGAAYPMSSQAGGGMITGLGEQIGGTASFNLRPFPGRAVQDFLDPAVSTVGTVTPLFTWSFGHHMGMTVVGDAAHNGFRVVYFGFNLSQMIQGGERLTLTQQVLDWLGAPTTYLEKTTYLVPTTGSVRVFVRDVDSVPTYVRISSDAQPAGVWVPVRATALPRTYTGILSVASIKKAGALKVNAVDTLKVVYEDAPGHQVWYTAAALARPADDEAPTVHHDLVYNSVDAQPSPVMAVVNDDIREGDVLLHYRVQGAPAYTTVRMTETYRYAFTAVIPASAVTRAGVEYYITAADLTGHVTSRGSAGAPIFSVVQPRTLAQ